MVVGGVVKEETNPHQMKATKMEALLVAIALPQVT
jgi:hypothetical protein